MPHLRIRLFGSMRVSRQSDHAALHVAGRPRDLLSYLVLNRGRPHPREVLASLFWGEQHERSARSCLSSALWRLRAVLEAGSTPRGGVLVVEPEEIGFNAGANWIDVAEFERSAQPLIRRSGGIQSEQEARALSRAARLYRGDLLDGCYHNWALAERERLQLGYLTVLERLMRWHEKAGDAARALTFALRILRIDPLRESIHRDVMRLYAQDGQRALAARQYALCRDLLRVELGVEPMEETAQLYAEIVGRPTVTAAPHRVAGLPRAGAPGAVRAHAMASLEQAISELDAARARLLDAVAELSLTDRR